MHPPCYSIIILCLLLVATVSSSAFQQLTNMQAKIITLYPLSNSSIPNKTYGTTFYNNFSSSPVFVYGINDYNLGNNMTFQDFSSSVFHITQSAFTLQIALVGVTSVLKFSISYFAASVQTNISCTLLYFANVANISGGTGSRAFTSYQSYNFSSDAVALTIPFLTAFFVQTSVKYEINITSNYISLVNFLVTIATNGDCAVRITSFYVLFYYPTLLQAGGYYVNASQYMYGSSVLNIPSFTQAVANYTQTIFVMGIRRFYGYATISGLAFGWSLLNITNDIGYLIFNKTNILSVEYSFFQIGKITSSTTNTTTNSTNSTSNTSTTPDVTTATGGGSSSYLAIIVGLVVGVIVVGVGILIAVKIFSHSAVFNLIPKKDVFRELPSLAI